MCHGPGAVYRNRTYQIDFLISNLDIHGIIYYMKISPLFYLCVKQLPLSEYAQLFILQFVYQLASYLGIHVYFQSTIGLFVQWIKWLTY